MSQGVEVSQAVVVWTGYGETAWPARDERRLVDRFGEVVATDLLPRVVALEDDFFSSDAVHHVADLSEATTVAKAEFRDRHPDVSTAAAEALAWCYSYDHR